MYDLATFAMLASTVVGGAVATWLLARQERTSAGFALGAFMLVIAVWSATHVGALLASTPGGQLRFSQLSYLGVAPTPVAWFVFAVRFADRDHWLSTGRLALLVVVPLATVALALTADAHSLFYSDIALGYVDGEPTALTAPGPWHVVNVLYSYLLLALGTGLLVSTALSDNRLYRRQSVVLICLVCTPWAMNALYHLGVRPFPLVDPTPLVTVAVGVPLSVIVVRNDLASFLPVAYERVVRTLDDPVLVVSDDGRVVDSNAAARTVLGGDAPIDGAHVSDVLPEDLLADGDLRPELDDELECTVGREGTARTYLARRRAFDPGRTARPRGAIVTLTDITVQTAQRRDLEAQTERLTRKNEQLERLADIVSHDLQAPLSTAEKLRSLLAADIDDPDPAVEQSLEDMASIHERLRGFAGHLPRLARESTDVESTEACDLAETARAAWNVVDTRDLVLAIESTCTLQADPRRLGQVFENLFRNAVEHGAPDGADPSGPGTDPTTDGGLERSGSATDPTTDGDLERSGSASDRQYPPDDAATTLRVGARDGGFYVADDGPGIPSSIRERVFEYGVSDGDGSGFGLAIVRTIVEAHGWAIEATESADGGARFVVRTEV